MQNVNDDEQGATAIGHSSFVTRHWHGYGCNSAARAGATGTGGADHRALHAADAAARAGGIKHPPLGAGDPRCARQLTVATLATESPAPPATVGARRAGDRAGAPVLAWRDAARRES